MRKLASAEEEKVSRRFRRKKTVWFCSAYRKRKRRGSGSGSGNERVEFIMQCKKCESEGE